jgi:hypothetical protein
MIFIDDKPREGLWPRIVFYEDVTPGKHEISAHNKNKKIILNIEKSQRTYVRFDIGEKEFYPVLVETRAAEEVIKREWGLNLE